MNPDRIIAVRTDKTVYRDGNLCLKTFNGSFSKADVFNEALIQAKLEETDINIPKIREVTFSDGKWIIVSDYIKGKTLEQLWEENPDKADEYMDLFVNLQLEIHKHKFSLPANLKKKLSQKIASADLNSEIKEKLTASITAMPDCQNLCHGDFNMSNIIISDDNTPYVIDWAHASCGCPLADAATTYILFLLAENTTAAETYLDLFCKKSGANKQTIQQLIPPISAGKSLKSKEREREILYSLIK